MTLSLNVPEKGETSVMLVEQRKVVPADVENTGPSIRNRVLTDMVTIDSNGNLTNTSGLIQVSNEGGEFELQFAPTASFSLIVINEPSILDAIDKGDSDPYGVVEISRRASNALEENSIIQWILVGGLISGIALGWKRKESGNRTEDE